MNVETGEIRRWDSLTAEQQQSGEWIKLPTHDEDGVLLGRRDEGWLVRKMFDPKASARDIAELMRTAARRFDALGKPVP